MELPHAVHWRPETIESHQLAEGYCAAKVLQHLDIPVGLGRQIANYILRCGNELGHRGIDAEKLIRDSDGRAAR
jgi:hypothetical protein